MAISEGVLSQASKFKDWVEDNGGTVEPTVSDHEVARFRHADGVCQIYHGKKGFAFSDGLAQKAWGRFKQGQSIALAKRKRRTKSEETIKRLAKKHGKDCWFCGCKFQNDVKPTIEHLLSISCGGTNNIANLVLACDACNKAVGNMPIADKVEYRTSRHVKFQRLNLIEPTP